MRKLRWVLVAAIALIALAAAWQHMHPSPVYSDLDVFLDGGMVDWDGGGIAVDNNEPAWVTGRETNNVDEIVESLTRAGASRTGKTSASDSQSRSITRPAATPGSTTSSSTT